MKPRTQVATPSFPAGFDNQDPPNIITSVSFMSSPSHLAARCFMPYPQATPAAAAVGPLAGLTFAVKDIFDVAGYPTGCGNPHMLALSGIKKVSAPVVTTLLQAGAGFV